MKLIDQSKGDSQEELKKNLKSLIDSLSCLLDTSNLIYQLRAWARVLITLSCSFNLEWNKYWQPLKFAKKRWSSLR